MSSNRHVEMKPSFLKDLMEKAANKILPYQWEALNDNIPDAAPSHAIKNIRAAAGLLDEPHAGPVFQDSDVYKWIEASSHMLKWRRDEVTEKRIDELTELLAKAQLDDGYLNTYYILTDISKRFTNLRDNHELYCAGHLFEAGAAYYEATGKTQLLDVCLKYALLLYDTFGPEEGKLHGYPGHEEVELALIKLYRVTGNEKLLRLAKYFIDQRGNDGYFDVEAEKRGDRPAWPFPPYSKNRYYQAGSPVRSQKNALGHAVRQIYLLMGMLDTSLETKDGSLTEACLNLWKNITCRQMYVTGAVGQSAYGEAFTCDYDLPNDIVYGETCAQVALFLLTTRLFSVKPLGEYGDIMDTLLYNGTISGMNLEGNRFFYVNPMECIPSRSEASQPVFHVKTERRKWFGCACCPPNLARMLTQLPDFVFYAKGDTVFVNLFTCCEGEFALENGAAKLKVDTAYPYDGKISIEIVESFPGFRLALRLPGWAKTHRLSVNGIDSTCAAEDGYLYIDSPARGDILCLDLDMPVEIVRANPRIAADAGQIAVRRGPVVYCLEEADNGPGLWRVRIEPKADFEAAFDKDLLGGAVVITAQAKKEKDSAWDEDELYAAGREPDYENFTARFIPYYAWNNRGVGEMRVWIRAGE